MKKVVTIILICIGLFFCYKGVMIVVNKKKEENRIAHAKEGWHVEIQIDSLNIRSSHEKTDDNLIGKAVKGDIFEVLDYKADKVCSKENKRNCNIWYKIVLKDGSYGWVANQPYLKGGINLIDYNGKVDIAYPTVKFIGGDNVEQRSDGAYVISFLSINDINYKAFEFWDDRNDYDVTHEIYHEVNPQENKNQYWIKVIITDGSGKKASIVEAVDFAQKPAESEVKSFNELELQR